MDLNLPLYVTLTMLALPIGVAILLIILIVTDIVEGRKTKKQLAYFEELYKRCIKIYGVKFSQQLYDACREPWIGLAKTISVFEYHCKTTKE